MLISLDECRELLREGGIDDAILDDREIRLIRCRIGSLATIVYSIVISALSEDVA